VDADTLARLLYTSRLWRSGLFADHRAWHTLAIGKHHELRDLVEGEVHGKELMHEESL
jgi:hypothetical protein